MPQPLVHGVAEMEADVDPGRTVLLGGLVEATEVPHHRIGIVQLLPAGKLRLQALKAM